MSIFDSLFGGGDSTTVEPPKIEDMIPYLQAQQQLNQVDQNTPWGSIDYTTTYNEPLSYDAWFADQPSSNWDIGETTRIANPDFVSTTDALRGGPSRWIEQTAPTNDPRLAYDNYVQNFDKGLGDTSVDYTFNDEMRSLWDKQFDPNSYDNYSSEYMDRYNTLLQPYREDQTDRFQQNMYDRGLPEGGEVYGDLYRTTVGDPNARADTMAAQNAAAAADAARTQDYNKLAGAMGGQLMPVPGVDVMGPANMFMNANAMNAQNSQQGSSDFWNALGLLGGGYLSTMNPAAAPTKSLWG